MTDSKGIDYGMGQTNIDRETGICFGVINQNAVLQAWADSAEADYGTPTCPDCGADLVAVPSHTESSDPPGQWVRVISDLEGNATDPTDRSDYESERGCADYACDQCRKLIEAHEAFGDSPLGWTLDDGEYKAQCGEDGDIFILKSPFFTRAQFCSPCAPGACYLENPTDQGERAYCFAPDWFDADCDGACPYPVYRVTDGALIYSPKTDDSADV
jgi:hypothetical protein